MAMNKGAVKLEAELDRRGITKMRGEEIASASSGAFTRLISGERGPGRALASRLEREFGVDPSLWDEPVSVKTDAKKSKKRKAA